MPSYTFKKKERLCSHHIIDELFESSQKMMVFPLSVRWRCYPESQLESTVQVLITAPKKRLHHAVDRNRTRRMMRECYRMRKDVLYKTAAQLQTSIALSISYTHSEPPDFSNLGLRFDKMMQQLVLRLTESADNDSHPTQSDCHE